MGNTIRIGHASISENGTITGSAGDQNEKEVYVAENYNIPGGNYRFMLRPKDPVLAEKSAIACELGCLNNNIGYSQGTRNTLYHLAKDVNFDLTKVTTPCNTDCSAFMHVCALAGGANIPFSGNCTTTATMESAFGNSGYYEVFRDSRYLTSADYLKRGDILVRPSGHTIMVLGDGPLLDFFGFGSFSFATIKINVTATNISATKCTAVTKLTQIENSEESEITDLEALKNYTWSYQVKPLVGSGATTITNNINFSSSAAKFNITGLRPNCTYSITVSAVSSTGGVELCSASALFTTTKEYPSAIKNLSVVFEQDYSLDKRCTISFTAPTSWGDFSTKKGYRVSLIVNGEIIAHNDYLIQAGTANKVLKSIKLSDIIKNPKLEYHDIVQIGVQPWIHDESNTLITSAELMQCSEPLFLRTVLQVVDKVYLLVKSFFGDDITSDYKRVVIYNRQNKQDEQEE